MSDTKKTNIIYFPIGNKTQCEIYRLWESLKLKWRIRDLFTKKHFNYVLDNWCDYYSLFIIQKKIKLETPPKIILFGYRDEDYPLIKSYTLDKHIKKTISPRWFDRKFDNSICILFVPGGAEFFEHESWQRLFINWVSFKQKFDFLEGLPELLDERKIIFSKIFSVVSTTDDPERIQNLIEQIFDQAILRVSRTDELKREDREAIVFKLRINQLNIIHCKTK